jgi:hypothetical protein
MTIRVTHTPCHQPVDITDDNRLLTPDTDVPHQCPVTDGPYSVVRHGTRWTIQEILDPHRKQPIYTTQTQAQAEADQRNKADAERRQPRPQQAALFDQQETA